MAYFGLERGECLVITYERSLRQLSFEVYEASLVDGARYFGVMTRLPNGNIASFLKILGIHIVMPDLAGDETQVSEPE